MKRYVGPTVLIAMLGIAGFGSLSHSNSSYSSYAAYCADRKNWKSCHYADGKNSESYWNLTARINKDYDGRNWNGSMFAYDNWIRPRIEREWTGNKQWLRDQFNSEDEYYVKNGFK